MLICIPHFSVVFYTVYFSLSVQSAVDSFQPTIQELTAARVKSELAMAEMRATLQVREAVCY